MQVRQLEGALSANSVSGDVAVTGTVRKATVDTVSGNIVVDSVGGISAISLNSVSGNGTIRLDDGHPANFAVRTVSGRVQVDGVVRSSGRPDQLPGFGRRTERVVRRCAGQRRLRRPDRAPPRRPDLVEPTRHRMP